MIAAKKHRIRKKEQQKNLFCGLCAFLRQFFSCFAYPELPLPLVFLRQILS